MHESILKKFRLRILLPRAFDKVENVKFCAKEEISALQKSPTSFVKKVVRFPSDFRSGNHLQTSSFYPEILKHTHIISYDAMQWINICFQTF